MRYYLDLSQDIRSIMEFRRLDERGSDAYRRGFCVAKIVSGYSTIWTLGLVITVFVSPSIFLLQSLPAYRQILGRVKRYLRIPQPSPEEEALMGSIEFQGIIAEMLTALALGMAFGSWSPILLLLTGSLAPTILVVFHMQLLLKRVQHKVHEHDNRTVVLWQDRECSAHKLQEISSSDVRLFCENLVGLVKVPVPRSLIRWLSIFSLWFGMLAVLYDFGYLRIVLLASCFPGYFTVVVAGLV